MTREEAIADIKNNIKPVVGGKSLDMAIEALTDHSGEVTDWIPCSERLPEEGEKVLASTTNTVFMQVFKGTHGTSDSWWWNNNTIKTIYAWMPLPKPYKGGDDK